MTTTEPRTGIEFDKAEREVLLVCHDCRGVWRAFAWTMDEAERSAAAHEERTHPGQTVMRDRLTTRHAQRRKRATTA